MKTVVVVKNSFTGEAELRKLIRDLILMLFAMKRT